MSKDKGTSKSKSNFSLSSLREKLEKLGLSASAVNAALAKEAESFIASIMEAIKVTYPEEDIKALLNDGYTITLKVKFYLEGGRIRMAIDKRVTSSSSSTTPSPSPSPSKIRVKIDGEIFTTYKNAVDYLVDKGYTFVHKIEGQSARRILTLELARIKEAGFSIEIL